MITAAPGASFEAVVQGFPTGLAGTAGVRVIDNAGATTIARTTAGIAEYPAGSGVYAVTLTAPAAAGQYSVVWDQGGALSPSKVAVEDLVVSWSSLAVVGPVGEDLTTVANVRTYLRRSGVSDATEDSLLQLLITSCSRAIRRYTGRQLKPAEAGVAKKFRYDGSGFLTLAPYELSAVTSIVLYSDLPTSSQRTLAAQSATVEAEYRLEPRNATLEGTYLWLVLPEVGQFGELVVELLPTRRRRAHEVTVTGNWGANIVPPDVELACLIAVSDGYRNPEGFAQRGLGEMQFMETTESEPGSRSLPAEARALLGPYRRQVYGG